MKVVGLVKRVFSVHIYKYIYIYIWFIYVCEVDDCALSRRLNHSSNCDIWQYLLLIVMTAVHNNFWGHVYK
jgi:hypothetical protein